MSFKDGLMLLGELSIFNVMLYNIINIILSYNDHVIQIINVSSFILLYCMDYHDHDLLCTYRLYFFNIIYICVLYNVFILLCDNLNFILYTNKMHDENVMKGSTLFPSSVFSLFLSMGVILM